MRLALLLLLAACASAPGQALPGFPGTASQQGGWWLIGWTNPADTGLADYVALIAGGDSLMAQRILLHAEQDERLVTGERFGRPVIAMTRAEWLAVGNLAVGQSEVVRVSLRRTERR